MLDTSLLSVFTNHLITGTYTVLMMMIPLAILFGIIVLLAKRS